ncbi:MAG: PEP-CTERM sorting domain-containing protein [Verrucomicrobia bacterium]|nr:PEP-CTERM sorting domain-containing protein [Verrucomicrobiota bacterium]
MKTGIISKPQAWLVRSSLCLAISVTMLLSQANAATLTDLNSSASIDPSTQAGMYNWVIDGQDILAQQAFWFRTAGQEFSISTISAPVNSSLGANHLKSIYANASFSLSVEYLLTGGTPLSGLASLNESIAIHNTTTLPLAFHFFQYSDFDLGPGGDFVQLGTNIFGKFNLANQVNSASFNFAESVSTPGADHGQVGFFPGLLNSLNDGAPTTLSDLAGPIGPGDATWAFQWDVILSPAGQSGDTYLISKLKHVELVPEPSSIALGLMGLAGINWIRRRRS